MMRKFSKYNLKNLNNTNVTLDEDLALAGQAGFAVKRAGSLKAGLIAAAGTASKAAMMALLVATTAQEAAAVVSTTQGGPGVVDIDNNGGWDAPPNNGDSIKLGGNDGVKFNVQKHIKGFDLNNKAPAADGLQIDAGGSGSSIGSIVDIAGAVAANTINMKFNGIAEFTLTGENDPILGAIAADDYSGLGNIDFNNQVGAKLIINAAGPITLAGDILNAGNAILDVNTDVTFTGGWGGNNASEISTSNIADGVKLTYEVGANDLNVYGSKLDFKGNDSRLVMKVDGGKNLVINSANLRPDDGTDDKGILEFEGTGGGGTLTVKDDGVAPRAIGTDNNTRIKELIISGGNDIEFNKVSGLSIFTKKITMNSNATVKFDPNVTLDLGVGGVLDYKVDNGHVEFGNNTNLSNIFFGDNPNSTVEINQGAAGVPKTLTVGDAETTNPIEKINQYKMGNAGDTIKFVADGTGGNGGDLQVSLNANWDPTVGGILEFHTDQRNMIITGAYEIGNTTQFAKIDFTSNAAGKNITIDKGVKFDNAQQGIQLNIGANTTVVARNSDAANGILAMQNIHIGNGGAANSELVFEFEGGGAGHQINANADRDISFDHADAKLRLRAKDNNGANFKLANSIDPGVANNGILILDSSNGDVKLDANGESIGINPGNTMKELWAVGDNDNFDLNNRANLKKSTLTGLGNANPLNLNSDIKIGAGAYLSVENDGKKLLETADKPIHIGSAIDGAAAAGPALFEVDISANNSAFHDTPNTAITFEHDDAILRVTSANDRTLTLQQDLDPGAAAGGGGKGIIEFAQTSKAKTLTVSSNGGKTLGKNNAMQEIRITEGKVILEHQLGLNTAEFNVYHSGNNDNLTIVTAHDKSIAAQQVINIGADAGNGVGAATLVMDNANYAAATDLMNGGKTINFHHADAKLQLIGNIGGGNNKFVLKSDLGGEEDDYGTIQITSSNAAVMEIEVNAGNETIGRDVGHRVHKLIIDGANALTINPEVFAKRITIGDAAAAAAVGDTTFAAAVDGGAESEMKFEAAANDIKFSQGLKMGKIDFNNQDGVIKIADGNDLEAAVISSGAPAKGTIEMLGDGTVQGLNTAKDNPFKELHVADNGKTTTLTGKIAVDDVQTLDANGTLVLDNLTLYGSINQTAGNQGTALTFQGNTDVQGDIGSLGNEVGDVEVKAGTHNVSGTFTLNANKTLKFSEANAKFTVGNAFKGNVELDHASEFIVDKGDLTGDVKSGNNSGTDVVLNVNNGNITGAVNLTEGGKVTVSGDITQGANDVTLGKGAKIEASGSAGNDIIFDANGGAGDREINLGGAVGNDITFNEVGTAAVGSVAGNIAFKGHNGVVRVAGDIGGEVDTNSEGTGVLHITDQSAVNGQIGRTKSIKEIHFAAAAGNVIELKDVNTAKSQQFIFDDASEVTSKGGLTGNVDFAGNDGTLKLEKTINGKVDSTVQSAGTLVLGDTAAIEDLAVGAIGETNSIKEVQFDLNNNKNINLTAAAKAKTFKWNNAVTVSANEIEGDLEFNGLAVEFDVNANVKGKVTSKDGKGKLNFLRSATISDAVSGISGGSVAENQTATFGSTVGMKDKFSLAKGSTLELSNNASIADVHGLTAGEGVLRFTNDEENVTYTGNVGKANKISSIELSGGKDVEIKDDVSTSGVYFNNQKEMTLTLSGKTNAIGEKGVTTAGKGIHTLSIDSDIDLSKVGTNENRMKLVNVIGDRNLSVKGDVFSSLAGEELTLTMNKEDATIYGDVGKDGKRVKALGFSKNGKVAGNVYVVDLSVEAGKKALFANPTETKEVSIDSWVKDANTTVNNIITADSIEAKGDNAEFEFTGSTIFSTGITTTVDGHGKLTMGEGDAYYGASGGASVGASSKKFAHFKLSEGKNYFQGGVYAAEMQANDARFRFTGDASVEGDLAGKDTSFTLDTNTIKYSGSAELKGDVEFETTVSGDKDNVKIGNIKLDTKEATFDFSGANSARIVLNDDIHQDHIKEGTPYNVFTGDGTITRFANTQLDTSKIKNEFIKWTYDKDSGAIFAGDRTAEVIDERFADTSALDKEVATLFTNVQKGTDASNLRNEMGQMTKEETIQTIERLIPETEQSVKSVFNTTLDILQSTSINIASRFDLNVMPLVAQNAEGYGVAAGDEPMKHGAWVKPVYSSAKQDSQGSAVGYTSRASGGSLGFDSQVSDSVMVGIAGSFNNAKLKSKDAKAGNKTRVDAKMLSLYGSQHFANNMFVQGVATIGSSKVRADEQRNTAPGVTKIARAEYDITSYSAEVVGGYNTQLNSSTVFTPMVGLRYGRFSNAKYTETGADNSNLTVSSKPTNKLQGIVGAKVVLMSHVGDIVMMPSFHALLNYDFNPKTPNIDVSLQGLSGLIPTRDSKSGKMLGNIGTGIELHYGNMTYGAGYALTVSDKKYVGHQGSLNVRANF